MADLKTRKKQPHRLTGPGPGRPKGLKNKFTNLKQAFLDAFEKMGSVQGLYDWAKKNDRTKAQFYQMISKMLPSNIEGEINGTIILKLSNEFLPQEKK